MECIRLTLEDKIESGAGMELIENFERKYDIDILEHSLIQKADSCSEVMYSFLENHMLEDFIFDLIEYGIRIKSRDNFTDELFSIITSNKTEGFKQTFDYTIGIDDILENFYMINNK